MKLTINCTKIVSETPKQYGNNMNIHETTFETVSKTLQNTKNSARAQISPATIIVKELVTHGFNLELKSEDKIVQDLRTIEKEGFIESLKTSPFELSSVFIKMAQDDELRKVLQQYIDFFSKEKIDSEILHLVEDEMKKFLMSMTLLLTSPELRAWMRMKKKQGVTHPIQELSETLTKEEKLSTVDFKDLYIDGLFEQVCKTIKEKIDSDLFSRVNQH